MANSFIPRKSRRRKKTDFNPSQDYINRSVQEFLQSGGHIHKIETADKNYQGFLNVKDAVSPADEFLLGN